MLKILILFPNTSNEGVAPLAVASLSSIAKSKGWEVRYHETSFYEMDDSAYLGGCDERKKTGEFKSFKDSVFDIKPHELMQPDFNDLMSDYKPDILAVTANSLEYELFSDLMEKLPSISPKPFVFLGGCHATVDPEGSINNPHVDAVCIGEGEKPWGDFLDAYEAGEDVSAISNIWVKTKSGIVKNPMKSLMTREELWELPLDFSFFDDRHFRYVFDGNLFRRASLELSRGCPYDCTYCVNTGFKNMYKGLGKFVRVRPYENLRSAAKDLINDGIDMIQFQDESFFSITMRTLEEFCEWYGSEVRLPIMVQVRPESVIEKKVKLMADMNVPIQLSVGLESGSERILKEICNRRMQVEHMYRAFKLIQDYGIRTTAYTMIGFPTETREEVFQTIDLVRSLDLDVSIMSIFFPFKGTPLRDLCVEKGFISGDEPARSFTAGPILKNQPMSPKEIMDLRRCYALYTKLPRKYFPEIELCEKDYENHKELFQELVKEVNESFYKSWDITPRSLAANMLDTTSFSLHLGGTK
jgi:radical SAM superfamily enzyme YgiQ (UPF0313 family)